MIRTLGLVSALALATALSGCAAMGGASDMPPVPASAASTVDYVRDVHSYARPEIARVRHVSLDLAADFEAKVLSGTATLDRPQERLRLTMIADGPVGHLIVYAPPDEPYLCLEPVSHMTDALNRPQEADAGVIALPAGERLSMTVRFLVSGT